MADATMQLRHYRMQRNWTQSQLAQQLGTTFVNISRWERGETTPSLYFRQKLCELFQCTPQELGFLSGEVTPEEDAIFVTPRCQPERPVSPVPQVPYALEQVVPLVGREALLSQFVSQLCSGRGVFALTGLPGVGKTSFAYALASHPEVRQHFVDGILWASLGQEPHVQEELNRWAHLLNIPLEGMRGLRTSLDWVRKLREYIGERRMLLIVDDAWTLAEAMLFQVGGSRCVYLVTTRFPAIALSLGREQTTRLGELPEEEGLKLFYHLVPSLKQCALEDVRMLTNAVGGLPLALTLLGRHLYVHAHSGPPRRLQKAILNLQEDIKERFQLGDPGPVRKMSTQSPVGTTQSLYAAIAISVQDLPTKARKALRALAVFPPKPHSFSEEAALAVCHYPPEVTLDPLVDSGLLESDMVGRYCFHQTIADYARLQQPLMEARRRLVCFVEGYVRQYQDEDSLLEQELVTITSALEWALVQQWHRELLDIVFLLLPFLKRRFLHALSHALLQKALQAARACDEQEKLGWTWFYLGETAELISELSQAEKAYQESVTLARKLGCSDLLSPALIRLGEVIVSQGDHLCAEKYLIEGYELAVDPHLMKYQCVVLQLRGEIEAWKGNIEQEQAYYLQGLKLARSIQADECIGPLLQDLGVEAARRGAYQEAEGYYEEGFVVALRSQDIQRQSAILMNKGMLAFQRGCLEQAIRETHAALDLARRCANSIRISSSLQNLGIFESHCGHIEEAENFFQQSLELAQSMAHSWLMHEGKCELGMHYVRHRQWAQADCILRKVLPEVREAQAPQLVALALFGLAQIEAHYQHPQQSFAYARESLCLYTQFNHIDGCRVARWLHEQKQASAEKSLR